MKRLAVALIFLATSCAHEPQTVYRTYSHSMYAQEEDPQPKKTADARPEREIDPPARSSHGSLSLTNEDAKPLALARAKEALETAQTAYQSHGVDDYRYAAIYNEQSAIIERLDSSLTAQLPPKPTKEAQDKLIGQIAQEQDRIRKARVEAEAREVQQKQLALQRIQVATQVHQAKSQKRQADAQEKTAVSQERNADAQERTARAEEAGAGFVPDIPIARFEDAKPDKTPDSDDRELMQYERELLRSQF